MSLAPDSASPAPAPPGAPPATPFQIALYWLDALVDLRQFRSLAAVRVGDGAGCDFVVPAAWAGAEGAVLVEPSAAGPLARAPAGAELVVERAGRVTHAREALLAGAERVTCVAGPLRFELRAIDPSAGALAAPLVFDEDAARAALVVLAVHLTLLAAGALTPTAVDGARELGAQLRERLASVRPPAVPAPPPRPRPAPWVDLAPARPRAPAPAGRVGRVDVTPRDAAPARRGAPQVDPDRRERDRAAALGAGVLALLRDASPATASVFGGGGLVDGAVASALDGVGGPALGDAHGTGGLGTRGVDIGGGGSLDIGGFGPGGPGGRGRGARLGDIELGGGGKRAAPVDARRTVLRDAYDKDIVGRVLQRHWAQARYCYDRALSRDPSLEGKVVVRFEIGAAGAVADAFVSEASLASDEVEGCVLRMIRTLRFPPVPGGGSVDVTYPFVFRAAGH